MVSMAAWAVVAVAPARAASPETNSTNQFKAVREMPLEDCLLTAMQNNRRRPASRYAVAMAEAQHRQALAGYWPQIGVKGGYQRMDEAPNFIFPASQMYVPPQTINVPAGTALITVPAQLVNPAAPPGATVQLPVATPEQNINVAAQQFPIPAQDIKLMDPDNFFASLNAVWLLYDGGMRKGYREQARGLVEMMKQEARRTDLEIADSVKRLYYGSVLALQLHQVGQDTLARMEATLNLTETMYKEGGGKVKKTDFLDNKVMVESLRSMVALLEKNELMAQAALANTMGLPWNSSVKPADKEMPYAPFVDRLDGLVSTAYQFNPDWGKVEAGLRAAEGAVRTVKSDFYPRLAVTGELHKWWNDYNAGISTDRNKEGWTAGFGVEIPLFSGFLTKNKVAETRARVAKIKEEQFLLKEGLGLQIKDTFLGLSAAEKSYQATLDAMKASTENRDLNTRAYQNELVETEKVIRAQLMEALMSAQHYKARYDHIALQSQLNLLVGTEVLKKIEGK
ncbi:MAG: TolC family protein [Verrucomicrobia bacterium]|nr:TolC family protein [Verrucomicrobiota bacterium]